MQIRLLFLVATNRLNMSVCPSVTLLHFGLLGATYAMFTALFLDASVSLKKALSVRPSVRPSVGNAFVKIDEKIDCFGFKMI